uniref:NELL2-interacting cell ontogeny regulator 1 n=1 Tax=Ficedula albicollis TaxID=59894 RepID=A0A803V0F7_FICAL
MGAMALPLVRSEMRAGILLLSVLSLLSTSLVGAGQDSGSVIPAESRPCVDCHAFEFMQRALQDLKKTAYSLDTRVCAPAGVFPSAFISQQPGLPVWAQQT